jgi:hypothetical protein
MMIHIFDAIIVGLIAGGSLWLVLDRRRDRRAQEILDRILRRQRGE